VGFRRRKFDKENIYTSTEQERNFKKKKKCKRVEIVQKKELVTIQDEV
jgi:hypothetical protein